MPEPFPRVARNLLNQMFARSIDAATAVAAIHGRILDDKTVAFAAAQDLSAAAEQLRILALALADYLTPDKSKLN